MCRLCIDVNVEGLNCKRPIQGLASSKNIDPPTPSPPGECVPPAFDAGGGHTRWVERGWGVNILEDTRHCSVLYICKYFVNVKKLNYLKIALVRIPYYEHTHTFHTSYHAPERTYVYGLSGS
jgi:hypothetical protein